MKHIVATLALALACTYQLKADTLACKSTRLSDQSECYGWRAFDVEYGTPATETAVYFQECMGEAGQDFHDCLVDLEPCGTELREHVPGRH